MSIYIGNDLEDRLEALETENTLSGELRPGSRPKSRFCHILVSLSRLNRATAVEFCTGVELSWVSKMTV